MAQEVTLNEIMTAVREITFDRFIIPAFAIKAMAGHSVSIKDGDNTLTIKNADDIVVESFDLGLYLTMESLMNALIEQGIVVAYTPYFKGDEPSSSLIKVKSRSLNTDFSAFRKNFFSDEEITKTITWYYSRVLGINEDVTDTLVKRLVRPSERHLSIWVAYHLVDKRRLYENASLAIGQSFTDGSDYVGTSINNNGTTTTVQIGSVFSITEDPTRGNFYEDFNRVGSDNVWGDRYSFWFKLMLYLRGLLEEQFGDYSLRKTNVMQGRITMAQDMNFRSYYDSYPFALSPLARGIISTQ